MYHIISYRIGPSLPNHNHSSRDSAQFPNAIPPFHPPLPLPQIYQIYQTPPSNSHPAPPPQLLNITALLLTTQAILLLQPTHTPHQKSTATHIHAILNSTATLALLAAFIIIEYNKFAHDAPHFTSIHGKLGLISYSLFMLQAVVGLTQYYTPSLYGGVSGAKKVYKYYRMSGYVGLVLGFATVCAATQTGTGGDALGLRLWVVLVTSALVVVGVGARVKKVKLGL